jgi:hypothetical protein
MPANDKTQAQYEEHSGQQMSGRTVQRVLRGTEDPRDRHEACDYAERHQ